MNGPVATVSERGVVRTREAPAKASSPRRWRQERDRSVKFAPAVVASVDFVQDVNPVITRLGCNMGTCHGAKDGKAGFKAEPARYDPALRRARLLRRPHRTPVNFASPDDSLMLLKATGGGAARGRHADRPRLAILPRHPRMDRLGGETRHQGRESRLDRALPKNPSSRISEAASSSASSPAMPTARPVT